MGKRRAHIGQNRVKPYIYLIPSLVIFFVFVLSPVIFSLILSLYNFTGYDSNVFREYVGLKNFRTLFADRYFWISLRNTVYFVGASISIQVIIAMFLAIIIFIGRFKHSVLIRTVIFFPGVLAPVSVSLAWRRMLEQDGVINQILGIDFSWLSSVQLAIWCVVLVSIWQWVGYNLVIFYAGLQSIDIQLLEAADVDGASPWRKFFHITLPLLKPVLVPAAVLGTIWTFNNLNVVWLVTNGGEPSDQMHILVSFVYRSAFFLYRYGYAAALSMVIFMILLILGIVFLRRSRAAESGEV